MTEQQQVMEMKIVFKGGTERKYYVAASDDITDDSLRGSIAGMIKMLHEDDYPLITDKDGKVFCIPNLSEIIAIEARKYQ